MKNTIQTRATLQTIPVLAQDTLYVGVDIGKATHLAGFISTTLLTRHQRFESCPALSFENSREGCALPARSHQFLRAAGAGLRLARALPVTPIAHCCSTCKNSAAASTSSTSKDVRRDCSKRTNAMPLAWPTSFPITWKKGFKWPNLCRLCAASLLQAQLRLSCEA